MRHLIFSLLAAIPASAAEPARWQPETVKSFDIQLNDPPCAAALKRSNGNIDDYRATCDGVTLPSLIFVNRQVCREGAAFADD